MYMVVLIKCGETWGEEGRQKEFDRSRKVFASLMHSLRASMIPTFAATLGDDVAPIYEDAAREELDKEVDEEIEKTPYH